MGTLFNWGRRGKNSRAQHPQLQGRKWHCSATNWQRCTDQGLQPQKAREGRRQMPGKCWARTLHGRKTRRNFRRLMVKFLYSHHGVFTQTLYLTWKAKGIGVLGSLLRKPNVKVPLTSEAVSTPGEQLENQGQGIPVWTQGYTREWFNMMAYIIKTEEKIPQEQKIPKVQYWTIYNMGCDPSDFQENPVHWNKIVILLVLHVLVRRDRQKAD